MRARLSFVAVCLDHFVCMMCDAQYASEKSSTNCSCLGGVEARGRDACSFLVPYLYTYQHTRQNISLGTMSNMYPNTTIHWFLFVFHYLSWRFIYSPLYCCLNIHQFFYQHTHITNPPEADLRYVVTSPPVMFRPTPSFLAVMCGAMIGRCPWPLIIVDVSRIYMLFRASVSSNNKHQLLANFLHHDTSCLSIRFNFRWRVR